MKKTLKILALVLCVGLICTAFCGCVDLDELRAKHAVYNDDGTLLLNEKTYYPVNFQADGMNLSVSNYDTMVYVTPPDVPVLLASSMGDYYEINESGSIIFNGSTMFCVEELLEKVGQIVEGGYKPFGYVCYGFNEKTYEDERYKLSEVEKSAIEKVIKHGEQQKVPSGVEFTFEGCISIYSYEEYELFERYDFDICVLEEKYHIVDYNASIIYNVPEELNDVFSELLENSYY